MSNTTRAGLAFPVARVARHIREGRYAQRSGMGSGVFMAAVLEYLTAEVLELAGNHTKERKMKTVKPRHICLGAMGDDELNKFFTKSTISGGGVLPNVHKSLL